ncbi:MAG: phenylalanine--tRNA ligase subunit beta [Robiginitomaculum sp.]|nr:phenylalanine--tRNA ligase subunit beta [Robiginitomaculum sp.]MDQ7078133.1 phenylalanine--tRNA ligase subunit beta [Robiginitomaculum sp.]
MKFSISWLKEHLDTDASLNEILDAMTMAGLEVETVEDPAEKLAAFSVAKCVGAEKHPNADRLQVCTVETKDGVKQIVCGAPNARAGIWVIYAPVGAYVPGIDVTLKKAKIRDVESLGMMCSARELEAGDDHDGIIELAGDDWQIGGDAAAALGLNDPVIDFEVTPNRPDWLGVRGIARDLAAAGLGTLKPDTFGEVKGGFDCPVEIKIDAPEACPAFAGRVVRGVKNGPSPAWLQQRLLAIGLRPISALVDITNYLTYDRDRPLHVYDVAKLSGAIRARWGAGERFEALDGKAYDVTPAMCAIADDERVLGLGGVMGGTYSGCTDETTDVLIECAYFDPKITRTTGRATGIESDAKYRFERGIDPASLESGLDAATQMVLELCGGEASHAVMAGTPPTFERTIEFPVSEVKRLTGLDLDPTEIASILQRLGFGGDMSCQNQESVWAVSVPSWRGDAAGKADLVEEIARIYGFDKLPQVSLRRAPGAVKPLATPLQNRARLGRRALAGVGYLDAVTWSFCAREDAALFGGGGNDLMLANPISSELDCMRPSALVHLVRAAQRNADRGVADLSLMEIGPVYHNDRPDGQRLSLAGVVRSNPRRHWAGTRPADVFDIKGDVQLALGAMGAPVGNLQVSSKTSAYWHPGRSGRLSLGPKNVLAEFGEIHPGILAKMGIDGPLLGFEIWPEAMPARRAKAGRSKGALNKSDLLPLARDFAFVVDADLPADKLVRAAKGADKALIADVNLFDVYAGKGVEEGKKSLAIEVTIQPIDATLTDAQIETLSKAIIAKVEKATGGVLRG